MVGLSSYYKNAPFSLNEGVSRIMMAQNYENTVGKANKTNAGSESIYNTRLSEMILFGI